MRVTFVVSANKYTGAAAVAEHCCRALRAVGVDAVLLFVGGNNLEERLHREPWAAADLVKERSLSHLRSNLRAISRHAARSSVLVSHLPHDLLLCVTAGAHRSLPLVRSFRSSDHLRRDPFHRFLNRRAVGALLAHPGLADLLEQRVGPVSALSLPVPLEDRFRPGADPDRWRRRLAIAPQARVLGMVGKVARDRGFETLIDTASRVIPPVHVLAVGHGEAQEEIQVRAERLGLGTRLHWAGYQERELPALYAAMDVVLLAAAGSDHGHRAISEAQGCARPVVAGALPGVDHLVTDGATGRVVEPEPAALARAVSELLVDREGAAKMARAATGAADRRRFEPSGRLLAAFLREVCRLGSLR